MLSSSFIVGIIIVVVVVMLVIWLLLLRSSRRVNLTRTPEGQKPEWMRSTPPAETTAATQAEGEGITLYNYDQGEKVAASFAEQIEDILRSQMGADPYLQSLKVDFGTGTDGGLEIIVGDKVYKAVEQITDVRLREAITKAVATYNQGGK
ncbi:MAG TPA: hypothetical protein VHP14_02540 [Anaerolineales bacterium]|nr:hypothetical protein [Anaerolineales bacterium]